MAFSYKDYEESEAVKKAREQQEKNKNYTESDAVKTARERMQQAEQNKVGDWTGGSYAESLQQAMDKINNRQAFTYDLNGDALYQQYKDQYMTLGQTAMADTIGQASAMTGGYGNSYAATAGNQAYQSYLSQLNDKVPELYSLALDKYNMEGQDLYNQYNMYADRYNTEYGEYRDRVSDWQTEMDRAYNQYYNEANMDYERYADQRDYSANQYNAEREYDYTQYSDAYNRAFQQYQQNVSENQWSQEFEWQKQQAAEEMDLKRQQFEESVRQFNEAQDWEKEQFRQQMELAQQEYEESVRQYNETLAEQQRQYDIDNQYRYDYMYNTNDQNERDRQNTANIAAQNRAATASENQKDRDFQASQNALYNSTGTDTGTTELTSSDQAYLRTKYGNELGMLFENAMTTYGPSNGDAVGYTAVQNRLNELVNKGEINEAEYNYLMDTYCNSTYF